MANRMVYGRCCRCSSAIDILVDPNAVLCDSCVVEVDEYA